MRFEGVICLIAVRHHTKTVSHPETDEVLSSVSSLPCSHSSEVVVVLKFHILNHPSEALSIIVVPGAETSSFLWPQVNHFSGVVGWIRNEGGNSEGHPHKDGFTHFITDIIVHPE